MCNYLIQITPVYEDRAIYRCEHGVFHLAWDTALFHLSQDALVDLRQLMVHGITRTPDEDEQEIRLFIRRTRQGKRVYELWFDEAGLRLTEQEAAVLRRLLDDVHDWLDRQLTHSAEEPKRLAQLFSNLEQPPSLAHLYWN